jgi:hypothetical protein
MLLAPVGLGWQCPWGERSTDMRSGFWLVLLLAIPARADDPCGAWKLKSVSPDGKARECVVVLSQEGKALKGTYAADGCCKPAKDVTFEKGVLCVAVDGEFAGKAYGLTYQGKVRGDAIKGKVRWTFGWASGSFAFEGQRIEEDR